MNELRFLLRSIFHEILTRGGVEDTKLEAKAKDSTSEVKPSRGQGQRHKRKCSQKKKVFKIFFRRMTKLLTIHKLQLSSSQGQGNFSRTCGFEAKYLTFEAKHIKLCPRDHERPRGLRLRF